MVTNGLQRNVHSAGFFVYLVETTDMQQLCAFTLAICVVVVAQRFSPGKPLPSVMHKSRWQGKRVTAPGCPPLESYPVLCEIRSSCASSEEFQPSDLGQRGVRSKDLRQRLANIAPS